jgi:hypothetical protein
VEASAVTGSLPSQFLNAALVRYDTRRDPVTHFVDAVVPEDIGVVHALRRGRFRPRLKEPYFTGRYEIDEALCGARVKVHLPLEFDPGDPDACQRCAGLAWESGG